MEYAASGLQGLHQDDFSWGRLFLFSAGNDFYLVPVSVGLNVQQPVRQQVADGNVKAGTRLTAQATITLTAPAEGTMFLANAVVPITGTITAPASMHGYEITLRNKATNVVLFTANGHAHGTSLSFNEQWTNNVSSDAEVEIEVVAILDHDDNKTVKKTTIHCHH